MRDDGKITIEDIDETALAAGGLAFIWKGNVILAKVPGLIVVESIVVGGAVASFMIDGTEGVDNYVDFISEPTEWISTTKEETLPIIYEEVIAPKIVDPIVGWVETKIDQGIGLGTAAYRYGERKYQEGLAWAMRGLPSIKYF